MRESNVQPLSPNRPNWSVELITLSAPKTPDTPTSPILLATTPTQKVSTQTATKQLPDSTVTAMVSQMAVDYGNLTQEQKIKNGVLSGTISTPYKQLSQPGQAMKPGSGDFIAALHQKVPELPIDKVAYSVIMTGNNGVGNVDNLRKNVAAHTNAMSSSIAKATNELSRATIPTGKEAGKTVLTGKETPTQVSGIIYAAATLGTAAVTSALANPAGVTGILGKITSGNFAANLADKVSSGLSGVATSLGGLAKGAAGILSSGISGAAKLATSGIASIVSGFGGLAQNAFKLAEKSFGSLNAGSPNFLGGASPAQASVSETVTSVRANNLAKDELAMAEKELAQASRAFRVEESAETYAALKEAESKVAEAQQKIAASTENINPNVSNVSAQNIKEVATMTESGQLNLPSSANTGLSALPGGVGAFMPQVQAGAPNIMGTIKSAMSSLPNPAQLMGNIVSNVQGAITKLGSSLTSGISKIGGTLGGLASGGAAALSNIMGGASSAVTGLMSNLSSSISSLGNAPGQVKAAMMGVNTFKEKAAITSTLAATLDPKVPQPTFEEVPVDLAPDSQQSAQFSAQLALEELMSKREERGSEVEVLVAQYLENPTFELSSQIQEKQDELSLIDDEIMVAQARYERILTKS
jgi:hypothetical protein